MSTSNEIISLSHLESLDESELAALFEGMDETEIALTFDFWQSSLGVETDQANVEPGLLVTDPQEESLSEMQFVEPNLNIALFEPEIQSEIENDMRWESLTELSALNLNDTLSEPDIHTLIEDGLEWNFSTGSAQPNLQDVELNEAFWETEDDVDLFGENNFDIFGDNLEDSFEAAMTLALVDELGLDIMNLEAGLTALEAQLFENGTDESPTAGITSEDLKHIPKKHVTKALVKDGLQCSVCLEKFKQGARAAELSCQHHFHTKCIKKWLRNCASCPLCRQLVDPQTWKQKNSH